MNISNVINGAAMKSPTGKILPLMFSISLIYMRLMSKYTQESFDFMKSMFVMVIFDQKPIGPSWVWCTDPC